MRATRAHYEARLQLSVGALGITQVPMAVQASHLSRRSLVLAILLPVIGCLPIPNRVRDTPEVIGQLLWGGEPIARAAVSVVPVPGMGEPPSCGRAPLATKTDGRGTFRLPTHHHWNKWVFLLGESPEWNVSWRLCTRDPSGPDSSAKIILHDHANAWDTVYVQCELAGAVETDSLRGRYGKCTVMNKDQWALRVR